MEETKKVSITIDDLPFVSRHILIDDIELHTNMLLEKLEQGNVLTTGFVVGREIDVEGEKDRRMALLESWQSKGHVLGNHTYSHLQLSKVPVKTYMEDIISNEAILNPFWDTGSCKIHYFRFPYLDRGKDKEKNNEIVRFLNDRSYAIAPVTIDSCDYIFNQVYIDAVCCGNIELEKYAVDEYLGFLEKKVEFTEQSVQNKIGKPIAHILLLHANYLNSHHINEVISIFRKHNYIFVTLEEAMINIQNNIKSKFKVKSDSNYYLVRPQINNIIMEAFLKY